MSKDLEKVKTQKEENYVETVTLPSGKTLQVIDAKGKHLIAAQKLCGIDKPEYLQFALASQICRIDGERFVMEDMDLMPLAEVAKINTVVGKFLA